MLSRKNTKQFRDNLGVVFLGEEESLAASVTGVEDCCDPRMTFNNLSVELTSFDLAKKFLLKEFYKLPLRISLLKNFFKKIFFQKLTFYVNFIIIIPFIFQHLKQLFFKIFSITNLSL